jgi:hypothetical protein
MVGVGRVERETKERKREGRKEEERKKEGRKEQMKENKERTIQHGEPLNLLLRFCRGPGR